MKVTLTLNQRRLLWGVLLLVVMVRLFSLGSYPLADTTEARYAEIARLMAESGDWITPQIHAGVPFWGKPPLSTWLSAASIRILGVNEFAIRLPSLLLTLAVLAMVFSFAAYQRGREFALLATVICATTSIIFVCSGAVMTDTALLLGTTLSMVSFWRAITTESIKGLIWGYLLFVGLAIGLLAKGPIAVVLTALPIGGWIIWHREWRTTWHRIPWLTGLVLCMALTLPWYYMAEVKTPGFLNYFLVGEHWKRFLVSGWEGDLYGTAHSRPLGTIWIYWLVSALPWSMLLIYALFRKKVRHRASLILKHRDSWKTYLTLWALTPMVFFTPAGNILWTYVLPGIPALALLTPELLLPEKKPIAKPTKASGFGSHRLLTVATVTSLIFALAWVLVASRIVPSRKCQKGLVTAYENSRGEAAGRLVYIFKRPHSADFYARGKARLIEHGADLEAYFQTPAQDYFAVKVSHMQRLSEGIIEQVEKVGEFSGYYLLKEKSVKVDKRAG